MSRRLKLRETGAQVFGGFAFQDKGVGEAVAEVGEILEGPDDFLGFGDLDDLRVVGSGVTIAEAEVAVRELFDGGDPSEGDAGEIILLDLPDDLLRRRDLKEAVAVAGGDEGVAILQPDRSEAFAAEGLGPMTAGRCLAEEGDGEFPHDLSVGVILFHDLVGFVGDEVMAVVESADEAGVGMGVGFGNDEGQGLDDGFVRGDFEEATGSGLDDEGVPVFETLVGMDLDLAVAFAAVGLGGVVFPDDFLGEIHLDDARPSILGEEIAVGEEVQIVDGTERTMPEEPVSLGGIDDGKAFAAFSPDDEAVGRSGVKEGS